MLTTLAFFTLTILAIRAYGWLSFSLYGLLMLLTVASLDGTMAGIFDLGARFKGHAPLFFGSVTVAFGFAHTAYRIDPEHHLSSLKPPFYGFAAIALSLIPGYWLIPSLVPLYTTMNTLMLLMLISTTIAPLTWSHLPPRQRWLTIVLPLSTGLLVLSVYGTHFLGAGFSRDFLNQFNRLGVTLHILYVLSFGLIFLLDELRAKRDAQRQVDIAALEAAENALALLEARDEFKSAHQLADRRLQQLAEASHDIKQPIASLRRTISELETQQPGNNTAPILDAVNYLDQLASTYLRGGVDETTTAGEITRDHDGAEVVQTSLLTDAVIRLHAAQAQNQEITLEAQDEGFSVRVQPLLVVRLLSNLVANALVHSKATHIVIATEPANAGIALLVQDNGQGMTEEQMERVLTSGAKGANSPGNGLGLSIVASQAKQAGWTFNLSGASGTGTTATLEVPRSNPG